MNVIWSCRSTNGRWGAEIVSDIPIPPLDRGGMNAISWPLRGQLTPLGEAAGVASFRFDSASAAASTWVLPMDGSGKPTEAVEGVTVAWSEGLQSGRSGEILILGPTALIKVVGYRGRSSGFVLYQEGKRSDAPVSVLLALGLIEPKEPPAPLAAPPPPSGALQDALRRASIAP